MADTNKIFDIIIIGAGVAGMTAAIYAGRADKTVAIIDKDGFGGQILSTPAIENFPGFKSISGADLASNIYEQMMALPTIEHLLGEVSYIDYKRGLFLVSLNDKSVVCGYSVIFATGAKHKELNLDTKDVYYCATCDGPLFKNKNVLVVGSGNTGATYALDLATYCKQVYLCDITFDLCCEPILKQRILNNKKIIWLPNCTIKSVKNNKDGNLTSVTLSTLETLKCNAIFGAIGMIPQTAFVGPFATTNDKNYITATNAPGVFVAGDCKASDVKQAVVAAADGAIAAINAIKFVNSLK